MGGAPGAAGTEHQVFRGAHRGQPQHHVAAPCRSAPCSPARRPVVPDDGPQGPQPGQRCRSMGRGPQLAPRPGSSASPAPKRASSAPQKTPTTSASPASARPQWHSRFRRRQNPPSAPGSSRLNRAAQRAAVSLTDDRLHPANARQCSSTRFAAAQHRGCQHRQHAVLRALASVSSPHSLRSPPPPAIRRHDTSLRIRFSSAVIVCKRSAQMTLCSAGNGRAPCW
jgi:hypothetical protein